MPTRHDSQRQGLISALMISLFLGKRAAQHGVALGWTQRPATRISAFQRTTRSTRSSLIAARATLQGRDYNTTDLSKPQSGLPNNLKLERHHESPNEELNQRHSKEWTEENWQEHPELNPTLTFPTWAVPLQNAKIIQTLLSSDLTQPFLGTRDEVLQQLHPRPKVVQDEKSNPRTHKYILLHSSAREEPIPPELEELLQQHSVNTHGPDLSFDIQYHQFPSSYILEKILPPEAHPPPTSFETVGHVAHLNLKERHQPYAKLIGQVILESVPTIDTVIQKVGKVDGPFRTYNHEILAGRNDTTVRVHEHGIQMDFDLSKVYWCSRLAQERQVVLDSEIRPKQVVADAFCGVGAICLRAAQTKQCTILANDWNTNAVKYLERNFATNGLDQHLAAATNQDAYDFLMDLGFEKVSYDDVQHEDPDGEDSPLPALVADHILLNFPLKAPTFLGALRWWSSPLSESSPRLHVYTFARADPETDRTAEDVAVDMIASNLLPVMPSDEAYRRKRELDKVFGCQVVGREVRDVAPGKLVFCVSFTATPKLIRHMQGDFED